MIKAEAHQQKPGRAPARGWTRLVMESVLGPAIRNRMLILVTGRMARELCQSMLAKRNGTYWRTASQCGMADTSLFRSLCAN